MKNWMTKVFGLLVLTLLAIGFQPQLQVTTHGVDLQLTPQAFAEGQPEPEPQPTPDPTPKENPPQPAKKEENDQNDPAPNPKENPSPEPEPEPEPDKKDEDPNDFVSRQEYDALREQLDGLTEARQQEVVQRRVDHAINENYIDQDDEDAVAQVREIARNDATWQSYKKLASPKVPDHISAKRFQNKNLKSNKHTGDSHVLDAVLEHQKA